MSDLVFDATVLVDRTRVGAQPAGASADPGRSDPHHSEASTMKAGVAETVERRERPLFGDSRPAAHDQPLTAVSVLDTCVSDCAWCGEHNRVLIVTPRRTLSRCLSCRDERVLTEPPSWCQAMSLDPERRAAARPAPGRNGNRGGGWT